jgi:hypothetical protein
MFCSQIVVVESLRFFLCELNDLLGTVGKLVKHGFSFGCLYATGFLSFLQIGK